MACRINRSEIALPMRVMLGWRKAVFLKKCTGQEHAAQKKARKAKLDKYVAVAVVVFVVSGNCTMFLTSLTPTVFLKKSVYAKR